VTATRPARRGSDRQRAPYRHPARSARKTSRTLRCLRGIHEPTRVKACSGGWLGPQKEGREGGSEGASERRRDGGREGGCCDRGFPRLQSSPSCSLILIVSEPPTTPIATLPRSSFMNAVISAVTSCAETGAVLSVSGSGWGRTVLSRQGAGPVLFRGCALCYVAWLGECAVDVKECQDLAAHPILSRVVGCQCSVAAPLSVSVLWPALQPTRYPHTQHSDTEHRAPPSARQRAGAYYYISMCDRVVYSSMQAGGASPAGCGASEHGSEHRPCPCTMQARGCLLAHRRCRGGRHTLDQIPGHGLMDSFRPATTAACKLVRYQEKSLRKGKVQRVSDFPTVRFSGHSNRKSQYIPIHE
jgi:hypothetical protein